MTDFQNNKKDLMELVNEASLSAIKDAGVEEENFDAIYLANMASGAFNNRAAVASALADRMALVPADAHRIENGAASGGSAIRSAFISVSSGFHDLVLVVGAERMTAADDEVVTDLLASLNHPEAEYKQGLTMPGIGALYTRLYMERHSLSADELAAVAVKNHNNAEKNPNARFRDKSINFEKVKNSPIIADPLRLYHICPVSDGGAALILCSMDKAREFSDEPVRIVGSGQATDTQSLEEREDPVMLKSVKMAADEAFEMSGLERSSIDLIETHDAFVTLELAEIEAAGFFGHGESGKATLRGETEIDGSLPVNPSGGLKARGHPVGATGVAQAVEVVLQLRGEAGRRQVKGARRGFCCNFGGFGNNTVTHILSGG